MKIKIIYAFAILMYCGLGFSQNNLKYYPSNHEAIKINIVLNKKVYLPYEPILVEAQYKNISDVPQQLGSLDFFSLNIRYQVFKDSSLMERYFLWKESYGTGWFLTKATATLPNDTKVHREVLNHYLDLKGAEGELVIEIGYPIQGEVRKGVVGVIAYKTEKKFFTIQKISVKDTVALKLFEPNFNKLMDGLNFSKKELAGDSAVVAFNKIIELYPNCYLAEPASFYKAFYYLQKYTLLNDIENIKTSSQLFNIFMHKYPDTVYKGLVTEYLKTCNAMLPK